MKTINKHPDCPECGRQNNVPDDATYITDKTGELLTGSRKYRCDKCDVRYEDSFRAVFTWDVVRVTGRGG